jgi:hypothetical protein
MIAYDVALTTAYMTDSSQPAIGRNEKNINNNTAIHISTWSRTILGACLHIFMFKNTNLLRFHTLFYTVGQLFSAIELKIQTVG